MVDFDGTRHDQAGLQILADPSAKLVHLGEFTVQHGDPVHLGFKDVKTERVV